MVRSARLNLVFAILAALLWMVAVGTFAWGAKTQGWRALVGTYHDYDVMQAAVKKKCGSWEKLDQAFSENYEACRDRALSPFEEVAGAHRTQFFLLLLGPAALLLAGGMAWYWVESAER